jgi:hypothetical protein
MHVSSKREPARAARPQLDHRGRGDGAGHRRQCLAGVGDDLYLEIGSEAVTGYFGEARVAGDHYDPLLGHYSDY